MASKAMMRVNAKWLAEEIIKERVKDLSVDDVLEGVPTELTFQGREREVFIDMVKGFIDTARITIHLDDWAVMDDGFVRDEEVKLRSID